MRIDLHTRCFNDAHMLGFMFRHYDPIVTRYVVYDDGSTDGSLDMLRAHPRVEILNQEQFQDPTSRVLTSLAWAQECWKSSRGQADWVIVTDIDEHLYHPDLGYYLSSCKRNGVTMIPALGFQMLADDVPERDALLCKDLTIGAPWMQMNKLSIFSPDDVTETNYVVGRHTAAPSGNIVLPMADELLLLHYKYVGREATQQRHEAYGLRLRARDDEMSWGHKYRWSAEQLNEDWRMHNVHAVDLAGLARPWEKHDTARWWRASDEGGSR